MVLDSGEYRGYVSQDRNPEVIGTVTLERTGDHSWSGWFVGWKITIGRANPLALEGDKTYTGPWLVKVGDRRTTVETVDVATNWIEGVLLEAAHFVNWARRGN